MQPEQPSECRYFVSYTGIKLPLKLVNEISEVGLLNRNTYHRGYFDSQDKLLLCQKIVYDEVESEHRYHYFDNGVLKQATITEDDEANVIQYNELGETV